MAFTLATGRLSVLGRSKPEPLQAAALPFTPSTDSKRLSLLVALSSQAISRSQQGVRDLITEVARYANPSRPSSPRNLEEALMTVPDLETIAYQVIKRNDRYDVRQLESYLVAETAVPSGRGFDFYGSSEAFNTIAGYLFGKNEQKQEMAMTTPVFVSKGHESEAAWRMAFVMPSKYNEETVPAPVNNRVAIRRVDPTLVAVLSFSGYVNDEEVASRVAKLREYLETDPDYRIAASATPRVAQYNPPFTPPWFRRNELMLEVEPR